MPQHATHPTRRLVLLAVVVLLLVVWIVGFAAGDTVALRPDARFDPATQHVRLGDIADLEGDYAQALRELIVFPGQRVTAAGVEIRLAQVREALSQQGVNLGLVAIKGHAACAVTLEHDSTTPVASDVLSAPDSESPVTAPRHPARADGSVAALLEAPIDAADPTTVRGLIRQTLLAGLGLPTDEIELAFEAADTELLDQSTLGVEFKISPIGSPRLGRVNVRVQRLAGWGEPEERRVVVRVLWRTKIVVAARPIAQEQTFSTTHLTLEEKVFDRPYSTELFSLEEARGAVSSAALRPGDPVRREHLGLPMIVKRGRPVTLTIYRDGFAMTTSAFASEDAALGQRVPVRLEYRVRRDATVLSAVVTGPDAVCIGRHPASPHAAPATDPAADDTAEQVADASVSPSRGF